MLVQTLGRPELATDPRFTDTDLRRANVRALMAELDDLFAQFDLAHLRKTLDAAGITFGFVGTIDEALHDRRCATPARSCRPRTARARSSPARSASRARRRSRRGRRRAIGEHTDEILREYGFGDVEISRRCARRRRWRRTVARMHAPQTPLIAELRSAESGLTRRRPRIALRSIRATAPSRA